jgi:hypothetical protein
MNDLNLIRNLCPDDRLVGSAELASARGRLTDAIAAEIWGNGGLLSCRTPHVRHRCAPWGRGWALIAGGAVTAVAAGLAAAFLIVPGRAAHAPVVQLTAAQFLDAAATATLRQPASPPRPGQWVLSVTEYHSGAKTLTWLPATGDRDEVIRGYDQGAGGAGTACTVAEAARGITLKRVTLRTSHGDVTAYQDGSRSDVFTARAHCTPDAGYYPGMPTSPHLLWAYLAVTHIASSPASGGAERVNDLGKSVAGLMADAYLRPAQRAGLFRLMAATPGFRVVYGVLDAIGRSGTAIEWNFAGQASNAIIFNPRTYAFMGERTWPVASLHRPGANRYDGFALITQKTVSAPASAGQSG